MWQQGEDYDTKLNSDDLLKIAESLEGTFSLDTPDKQVRKSILNTRQDESVKKKIPTKHSLLLAYIDRAMTPTFPETPPLLGALESRSNKQFLILCQLASPVALAKALETKASLRGPSILHLACTIPDFAQLLSWL